MRNYIQNKLKKVKRISCKVCSDLHNALMIVTHIGMPRPKQQQLGKANIMIMIATISRGGAERVAMQLASGLADDFNVVLLYNKERENQYQVDKRVQVIRMPTFCYDEKMILSRRYVREVKRIFHIDVSISLLHKMNCRNVYSKYKDYVIVSERNNPKLAYPENYALSKVIYDRADHVVFQTKEVQSMFSVKTQSHSSILPNPVTISCLAEDRRAPKIVNVARLHPNKNQELLIHAFSLFLRSHPKYTLDLYGEGDYESHLKQLASKLEISDNVFFHGNVVNIHEQIADAGMFVLSSNTEGMSNALLEAMMMGLPCISTDCTGSKEVIQSYQNGILIGMGDVEGMADAMSYLAEHPEEADRMRKNAMHTAEAYRKEIVIKQWRELVEKAWRGIEK